jgi:hypothetical protein
MKSVDSAVRTGSLNKAVCASSLKGLKCTRSFEEGVVENVFTDVTRRNTTVTLRKEGRKLYFEHVGAEYAYGPVYICSRTPFIRINWDGDPSGYEENPDNWIFL